MAGCSNPAPVATPPIPPPPPATTTITIVLPPLPLPGTSIEQFIKQMPKPPARSHEGRMDVTTWPGLKVFSQQGKVAQVDATGPGLRPPTGPGIGADIKDVTLALGNPDAVRDAGGGTSLYVYRKFGLTFKAQNGKVSGLVMGPPELPTLPSPGLPPPLPGASSSASPSQTESGIPILPPPSPPPLPGPPRLPMGPGGP